MKNVKKSIDKKALHKREYDSRVNERQMQITEEKVDTSKALDASLVDTKSSRTESEKQDTSSSSGNDTDADDADIKPVYDEEPMVENAEQCHNIRPLPAKLTDNQITELLNQFLESNNICLKRLEPTLQSLRNQSVVRQPTAFKSERSTSTKPRFASQVDVNNDLSKPVTTHYFPKEREFTFAKPHHVTASSESRNSSKNMPRFSSNGMVHNHYLEEAKKKTHERGRKSRPSVMPSAKLQSTTNDCKPKPRSNTQTSSNWPASKSSCKCVFNANHDACVTKFLNDVNSRAKVPFHKITKRYKPVEQISIAKKPERQIPTEQRFSIKKTSVVHEKTMTPRSYLRWKQMGRIFKTVGLRWVPTRKIFTSSTTTVDSEPPHGSNTNITNLHECIQTLDSSAGTSISVQEEQNLDLSEGYSFQSKERNNQGVHKRKCDIWETKVTWDSFDTRDIC
ncbi:hypothetical protein Tco_0757550 [Tanacetum coccineum]